jgi:acyl carrier protein
MTREHVMTVVIKHLSEAVDGLSPDKVDPKLSMKDLGANSLDIVEVVSSSMRELKVKIPRAELVKLTNVDGLVDLLYTTASQSAGAQAKAP